MLAIIIYGIAAIAWAIASVLAASSGFPGWTIVCLIIFGGNLVLMGLAEREYYNREASSE